MTDNIAPLCPAVAAYRRYENACNDHRAAVQAGESLHGPSYDVATDRADELSRAIPRTADGALLHLSNVAGPSPIVLVAYGVYAPPAIADEARRLAELLPSEGRSPAFLDALEALHARCREELEPRSRVWRSIAAALEWAAPERVVRPEIAPEPVPALRVGEADPAVLAHHAWATFSEWLAAAYRAGQAELEGENGRKQEALSYAFADAVPNSRVGALLKLSHAAAPAEHIAGLDDPSGEFHREWLAMRSIAPELRTLVDEIASADPAPNFVQRLAQVSRVCVSELPEDHALRRAVTATLAWASRPRAA